MTLSALDALKLYKVAPVLSETADTRATGVVYCCGAVYDAARGAASYVNQMAQDE